VNYLGMITIFHSCNIIWQLFQHMLANVVIGMADRRL